MEGVDVSKYWMLCIYGIIVIYIIAWFILDALGKERRAEFERKQKAGKTADTTE